ncbi:hypothetical protein SAMN05443253_11580 [Bacillus sp. OK048]|nr:hypothetical protein [Bacillus sp. OK048]SDN63967.1 hypothetical protein SAMN05443253_11580 [Bacillus sp. OK048]
MKKPGGVAVITAATLLAFYPLSELNEQLVKESSLLVMENPESEGMKGKNFVYPDEHVPVMLVETIDGDTIKVWVNGKMETVLFIDRYTRVKKSKHVCSTLCNGSVLTE